MSIEAKEEFRPKIVAFCCNWCSYAGADLAGSSRLVYPADVKIIRVVDVIRETAIIQPETIMQEEE